MKFASLGVWIALGGCEKPASSPVNTDCTTGVTTALDKYALQGFEKRRPAGSLPPSEADYQQLYASIGALKAATITSCIDDLWAPEVLACMATTHELCEHMLTSDQSTRKNARITEAAVAATGSPACERYAKMEVECGGVPTDLRPTILDYCAHAASPGADAKLAWIAAETTCATSSADCASYKACTAK